MVALARTRDELAPSGSTSELRPARTILSRLLRSPALRFGEALSLPSRDLADLPLPPSLVLRVDGVAGYVRVELRADAAEEARASGELVIDAAEWRALSLGAEADRVWPAGFAALCAEKKRAGLRFTPELALDGAQPDVREQWSAARVLERLGAEVVSLELP